MTGKKIEITLKKDNNSLPEEMMEAEECEELLNRLVGIGKMMSKNSEDSNFKICVSTLADPEEFFTRLNQMIEEARIEDVKVVLNMKLIK